MNRETGGMAGADVTNRVNQCYGDISTIRVQAVGFALSLQA
jgi:hypothetical protein